MLKNTDLLSNLSAADIEEVKLQLNRINSRLQVRDSLEIILHHNIHALHSQTVEVNVYTVRDLSQVDSLNCINQLIDEVIRSVDPIVRRQKCQEYLNACLSDFQYSTGFGSSSTQISFIDKKFESHLLGCTLDDQKRIKKRLEALLNYMAQQIIIITD